MPPSYDLEQNGRGPVLNLHIRGKLFLDNSETDMDCLIMAEHLLLIIFNIFIWIQMFDALKKSQKLNVPIGCILGAYLYFVELFLDT